MRDQTSYTSSSVAWDVENMSDENMLQDAKIISVILAFQKCRGLKSINSTICQRQYCRQQVPHGSSVKRHCLLDAVVGILVLHFLNIQIDKIGPTVKAANWHYGRCC